MQSPDSPLKVAEYISNYLALEEVTHAFGMSGANIEDLYTAIHAKNKTSIVLAKNEYNAATMAIGSYLSTQKMAVVLTTSGPGVLNTLPILAEAFTSKIPFVLIAGHIPLELEGHGAFQDTSGVGGTFDIGEMLKHCSTFYYKIKNPDEVPKVLDIAFFSALKNKKPAVIVIPKNIFNMEIKDIANVKLKLKREQFLEKSTCPLELINAINFTRQFQREENAPPLIILGEELVHLENMATIRTFINKTGAAVALTPSSKGLFDHNSPQFLGLIGVMGHENVDDYLKRTEHVVLVGTNFDLLNRYQMEPLLLQKNQLIIKEEKGPGLFQHEGLSVCEIYGNISDIFSKLNKSLIEKPQLPFDNDFLVNSRGSEYGLKNIIHEIQDVLEADANIFVDAGNTGAFVIHNLNTRGKGLCYVSLGMGGMGNSIGAAIGSSAATKKKSYVFLGDGSFLMYGLEIHTALEYNLPVHFFIFNNNSHGMCSTREDVFMGAVSGINNFRQSQYADGMAKTFPGIAAYEVNNLNELNMALSSLKKINSPAIVSINIPNTEAPPFKTFRKISEAHP